MKFDWKKFDGFLLFAAGATLLALLHPGDAAWTPAEAETVRLALEANAAGGPASPGACGTAGPAAVWLTQLFLLFTSDPVAIASAVTVAALLGAWAALWRLAGIFHVPAGPGAALCFCSPYLWFYLRMPVGTAWLVGLSLLYAMFLALYMREGKAGAAVGSAATALLMSYLNPAAILLPAGAAAGALVFRPAEFRRDRKNFALGAAALLLAASPALHTALFRDVSLAGFQYGFREALLSARCLTGFGFSDRFAPETGLGWPGILLFASVPAVAFLVVLGVAIVIRRVRRGEGNTFDRVAGGCALTLLIGLPLSPLLFPGAGGEEYGAVFAFAWLLPAWRGYAVLASDYRLFGRLLLTAALALELLFLLDFSRQIRSNAGGASESFGTSLGRQWLVAGRLAAARRANPDLRVEIKVDRWRDRPEMLRTLLRLADGTELPPAGEYVGAVLLPSRSGCGIDLIFLEKPVEH